MFTNYLCACGAVCITCGDYTLVLKIYFQLSFMVFSQRDDSEN